jgi:hypothetical protein
MAIVADKSGNYPDGVPPFDSPLATSGGAVSVADGADVAQGAVADAAYTTGNGTVISLLKGLFSKFVVGAGTAATATRVTYASDGATIPVAGLAYSPTVTVTPAAGAYGAGDVLQGALTLASAGPTGGGKTVILGARLLIPITAVPSGMTTFTLHLYSITPPSALADNAAWNLPSGDRASYLGFVNLGTPVDLGDTLYVETNSINKPLTVPSGGSVFGYLVTVGAYTATNVGYVVTLDTTVL